MTETEKAYQGAFDSFDSDNSGTIDINELHIGLSKQEGTDNSFSETAMKDLFEKFDLNNNGVLEKDEFVKLMDSPELMDFFSNEEARANKTSGLALMTRAGIMGAFQETFKLYDADNDGTIDLNELQIGLSNDHNFSFAALKDLLKKFDTNSNGVLERDEFANLMHSAELEEFFAAEESAFLNLDRVYKLTPTPEETPTFVNEKLIKFNQMLDKVDTKKKKVYTLANEKCPELCRDDFKLMFLRCEVFNVKPSVDRFVKYWDKRLEIFGEEKAFLPMTLEGAMKGYEKVISSNRIAVAEGITDPDGRAIVFSDYKVEAGDYSSDDLIKDVWYQYHVALKSESAQKRGLVFFFRVIDNLSECRVSHWKKLAGLQGIIPLRMSAIHVISPPMFVSVVLKIAKLLLGSKLRNRIYMHSGSVDEILASLSKYGLGTKDKLPEAFGGDLKFSSATINNVK